MRSLPALRERAVPGHRARPRPGAGAPRHPSRGRKDQDTNPRQPQQRPQRSELHPRAQGGGYGGAAGVSLPGSGGRRVAGPRCDPRPLPTGGIQRTGRGNKAFFHGNLLHLAGDLLPHPHRSLGRRGSPVLASDIGTLRERVNAHGGGWLLDFEDPQGSYRRILEIAVDKEEYNRELRRAGPARHPHPRGDVRRVQGPLRDCTRRAPPVQGSGGKCPGPSENPFSPGVRESGDDLFAFGCCAKVVRIIDT